jgi:hypothetical protein
LRKSYLKEKIKMLFVEIGLFLISLAAIFVAWRALKQMKELNAKLDRYATTLYETRQEQRKQGEEIQNRVAALDVAIQKSTGNLRFDPNASLTELFETEPRAQGVLAAFHIGGCASCAVDENSTLADAVRERGADLDRVLAALNTLPDDGAPVELRTPNVKFSL